MNYDSPELENSVFYDQGFLSEHLADNPMTLGDHPNGEVVQAPHRLENNDAALFARLRREWKEDSIAVSSVTELVMHPAYQRILAMGKDALPYILSALREENDHWYYALEFIAGSDIAEEAGAQTSDEVQAAWLEWGYRNNYI